MPKGTNTQSQPTTATERAKHVRQANANQAIEGFAPDESDKAIQAQYIAGTAGISDLLAHARQSVVNAHKKGSQK